jgi:thioredoxin reductase
MNCQVDVIIIGDSCEGHDAVKKIASAKPSIKVAFISKEFKSATTHDYLNVEYIKDEVVFTDYKNRLFGCYLKSGDRIYSTHLIIASGLVYEPLMLGNKQVPCVFNNTADIPKAAKNQSAIVIGQNNADVKFALEVAKKYKHVYLCTKTLTIENITPANVKKLAETDNIVALPNTSLKKVTAPEGVLQAVELDNYSTVTCSAIFIKTKAMPEVSYVSDKLIQKNETGHLIVSTDAESKIVPKCFAIGNCASKNTQRMGQLMVEAILKDF